MSDRIPPLRWRNTWDRPRGPGNAQHDYEARAGNGPVFTIGRIYEEPHGPAKGTWFWTFYGAWSPPELQPSNGREASREDAEAALASHWARWLAWRRSSPDDPPKVWKDAYVSY